jgi:hypothetical protein
MVVGKALALNRLGEGSNPDSKCGADFNKYFEVVNPSSRYRYARK